MKLNERLPALNGLCETTSRWAESCRDALAADGYYGKGKLARVSGDQCYARRRERRVRFTTA